MKTPLILLFLAFGVRAQGRLFWVSQAAQVAGNLLDARSSYGYCESNPLLRSPDGRFGMKAAAIKLSMSSALVAGAWLTLKRHGKLKREITAESFAAGAAYAAIAIRNYRVRGKP